MVLGSVLACSGQATQSVEVTDPDAQLEEPDAPQLEEPDAPRLEARPTVIHVINGSLEMRSRYALSDAIAAIRPAAVDHEPAVPTCDRIDCATLSSGETLAPETQCARTLIAPARVDLEPGAAAPDYQWNGAYPKLTSRNCYITTTFEPGTPMLANVCFGIPGPGPYDAQDFRCTQHPFAYGEPLLEIELE
jgi:hypothetical protein